MTRPLFPSLHHLVAVTRAAWVQWLLSGSESLVYLGLWSLQLGLLAQLSEDMVSLGDWVPWLIYAVSWLVSLLAFLEVSSWKLW